MDRPTDPFVSLEGPAEASDLLVAVPDEPARCKPSTGAGPHPVVLRLAGFDLLDNPLVAGWKGLPGHLLAARATVPLSADTVGHDVLVLFENGDSARPIVIGVVEGGRACTGASKGQQEVVADGRRRVITADREIVLRCGAASITLTRAGKVVIEGSYVLSRSSGYNKIKGAAIDIN